MYERDKIPRSCNPKMQFGELKLNLQTLIGYQKFSKPYIDLKILPHKLEDRSKLLQQILLNLDILCKSYSTLKSVRGAICAPTALRG